MTWHDKVMWTEGMFLQPQHFQQQDRAMARQLDARVRALLGHGAGFVSLQIDDAALLQGQFALAGASGITTDGVAFAIPGHDAAPPALRIPEDARDELIVLALTLARPGVPDSDVEGGERAMPTRFAAVEVDAADTHAVALRAAPLQVGRLNLRLMLARDANDGQAVLGVARLVERRDGRVLLDKDYVPPMLHAAAHAVLDGHLREVLGMLHQRGEALAARLAQPGRAGVGEIVDFLLLQVVNRHEALFAHAHKQPLLHPERLYELCVGLGGELATFRDPRRPIAYPDYAHEDLAGCFRKVMADLRQSLSMVLDQSAVPIELHDRKYDVRLALIPDRELQRKASFVLAVSAQLPTETLRKSFPERVKIGPVERIAELVNHWLPGIDVRPMPVAPRQIPYHAGMTYFELETRASAMWKELENSGGLAIRVSGEEFPGIQMELWAIR